ncbi:MAG: trypsin-like peptidase domain-containing protein [Pyrinomonadaceae bacterium]|nr:trypsin-like peptidase domain-containing protein [Pyrinomonadaceae bacterium]
MKRALLLLILYTFFNTACTYGQIEKPAVQKPTFNVENFLKKQILLTNSATFTGERTLDGASGFLISHNGSTFAVSAKHLLGEAGGVEPEVKITDLGKNLLEWKMSPRVVANADKETINVSAKELDFSNAKNDILLLKVTSNTFDIGVLTPNFNLPSVGDKLFMIGCPYSETGCRQNSYELKFVEFDKTEALMACEMKSSVDLAGFSGAPLVDTNGEVVGVLVSGGKEGGKSYAVATHIKEIQKIK